MKAGASVRFIIDFAIPVLFLLIGVGAKWLMDGGPWSWDFICLGPDLLLGAFAAEVALICDIGKRFLDPAVKTVDAQTGKQLIYCVFYLVVNLALVIFACIFHRKPAAPVPWTAKRAFWLIGIWNLVGIGMILGFLMLIKLD